MPKCGDGGQITDLPFSFILKDSADMSKELVMQMPNPDQKVANGLPLYTSFINYFGDDTSCVWKPLKGVEQVLELILLSPESPPKGCLTAVSCAFCGNKHQCHSAGTIASIHQYP